MKRHLERYLNSELGHVQAVDVSVDGADVHAGEHNKIACPSTRAAKAVAQLGQQALPARDEAGA